MWNHLFKAIHKRITISDLNSDLEKTVIFPAYPENFICLFTVCWPILSNSNYRQTSKHCWSHKHLCVWFKFLCNEYLTSLTREVYLLYVYISPTEAVVCASGRFQSNTGNPSMEEINDGGHLGAVVSYLGCNCVIGDKTAPVVRKWMHNYIPYFLYECYH